MPIKHVNDIPTARSNFSIHRLHLRSDGELRPKLKTTHALGRRTTSGPDAQPVYWAPRTGTGFALGWRSLDFAESLARLIQGSKYTS